MRDHSGKPRQTRLIAFLDDASRLLCHGQFIFEENRPALNAALKLPLYKRGVPQTLYVDNGSTYASATNPTPLSSAPAATDSPTIGNSDSPCRPSFSSSPSPQASGPGRREG